MEEVTNKNWDSNSETSSNNKDETNQNEKQKISDSFSNLSEYNEKEIKFLDRYLPMIENAFDVQ